MNNELDLKEETQNKKRIFCKICKVREHNRSLFSKLLMPICFVCWNKIKEGKDDTE